MITLESDIQYLKGVGPVRARSFKKKGIEKVGDLLYYLPFRYEDREFINPISMLEINSFALIRGKILHTNVSTTFRRKIKIFEMVVGDDTGILKVQFFNMPYLKNVLKEGKKVYLYGKVLKEKSFSNFFLMQNPEFEVESEGDIPIHRERIIPVYRKIGSLNSKKIRELIFKVLKESEDVRDTLPDFILDKYNFPQKKDALKEIHFPVYRESFPFSREEFLKRLNNFSTISHKRMIYEEFFLFQLGLKFIKKGYKKVNKGRKISVNIDMKRYIGKILPFKLTEAQKRVMREIVKDLTSTKPMNRLLQGDVGSGKTIIALMTMLIVVKNGFQTVLMAPTEILAEQHFFNFKKILRGAGLNIKLLKSGLSKKEKDKVKNEVEKGDVDILIGTHSVIEGDVRFKNLGLVIVDEQHRFGVAQRMKLYEKGEYPDILVMTATPIPRTLALTLYGDLDISVIDELPPNRMEVETKLFFHSQISEVYFEILNELKKGNRGYFVFPIIEESEKVSLKSAVEGYENIKKIFSDYSVVLLHGRMKAKEKESIMRDFDEGKVDILVSTTVIEVGIDVKDATFIVIEHAERFGLSQLHQLRGRVGRGGKRGKCFLIAYSHKNQDTLRRLNVFVSTNDGFKIAEEDMKLRGPGELGGLKQWGIGGFKFGNILRDRKILEVASNDAGFCIENNLLKESQLKEVRDLFRKEFKFIKWG